MKYVLLVSAGLLLSTATGYAAGCVNGVYRAGCAGPNGAAVVRKPVTPYHPYHPGVSCASGPYRAGCAGPHGAVVRRYP